MTDLDAMRALCWAALVLNMVVALVPSWRHRLLTWLQREGVLR